MPSPIPVAVHIPKACACFLRRRFPTIQSCLTTQPGKTDERTAFATLSAQPWTIAPHLRLARHAYRRRSGSTASQVRSALAGRTDGSTENDGVRRQRSCSSVRRPDHRFRACRCRSTMRERRCRSTVRRSPACAFRARLQGTGRDLQARLTLARMGGGKGL